MSSYCGSSQIGAVHENHSLAELFGGVKVHWHGVRLYAPFWGDDSHSLAVTLRGTRREEWLHLMINAYWQALELRLPSMLPATPKSLAAAHRHVSAASLGNSRVGGTHRRWRVLPTSWSRAPWGCYLLKASVRLRAEARSPSGPMDHAPTKGR